MQRGHSGLFRSRQGLGFILLAFCIYTGCTLAQERAYYGGGTGEPDDPYQIRTSEQFVAISAHSEDWGSCFRLMADVNLVDMEPDLIAPIGNHTVPFSGVFDGNDFAIENFVLHSETLNDVGIFGVVSTQDTKDRIDPDGLGRKYVFDYEQFTFDPNQAPVHVENVNVVNVSVSGKKNVGVVAARCYGSIRHCRVVHANVVNSGTRPQGGSSSGSKVTGEGVLLQRWFSGSHLSSSSMVGHLIVGYLVDCHVSAVMVDGVGMTGGVVGFSHQSRMVLCSAQGSILGDYSTGGLVGDAERTSAKQCRAHVSVSGGYHVGGLAGIASGDLIECCTLGRVEGTGSVGGFIGDSGSSYAINCYSVCDVNSSGAGGGAGAGGFMGGSSQDSISFCYSAGRLFHSGRHPLWPEGPSYLAGFIGNRDFSACENQATRGSFWNDEMAGVDAGVNHINMEFTDTCLPYEEIYRATTQEMWTRKTYEDVGWDFNAIWVIEEGESYPVLQWELPDNSEGQ